MCPTTITNSRRIRVEINPIAILTVKNSIIPAKIEANESQ
tara:strand:+ start:602 stop:721 length:120 start_codon:yes stop_codon:yes gene_type:complete